MMAIAYNGWPVVERDRIVPLVIAGESFAPGVLAGDVHTVLGYVAQQLHERVEPIVKAEWHQADDWGYSKRANKNNPNNWSVHAAGAAIDYNATRHPNGKGKTWTPQQYETIAVILGEVNNVVRNLTGYDEMHFEIKGTVSQVAAAAARVIGRPTIVAPRPPASGSHPAVVATQRALNFVPALGEVDGIWGQQTEQGVNTIRAAINGAFPHGVREAQTRVGTKADGSWGAMSRAALKQTIRELQAAWGAGVDGDWGANTEARWLANRAAYFRG